MTIVAPFGLQLAAGLGLEVNGQELMHGALRSCLQGGRIVEMDLPDAA